MVFRIFIWVVFIIGGSIGGFIIDRRFFYEIWHNSVWHIVSFIFGIILLRIVMKISRNTGKTLSKHGREGDIPRMETNKLVKEGVYGCMRHPMHLGLILFPVSIAFIMGSISFILLIAPVEIILIIIMIYLIEEPEAIKKFGEEYYEYKKSVPFFNFKPECLKKLIQPTN
jgi:protein-S-isoprenylcysteine O-methyltransferase Ste14